MAQELSQPPTSARRTQKQRREATRARLMSAAVRCIGRDGYAATTLNNVAQEAGLSKGAVQHHFKDKRALMMAVVEAGWSDTLGRLRATAAVDGPLRERLDVVVGFWIDTYSSPVWTAGIEVNNVGRSDPVLRDHNRVLYREGRKVIERHWAHVFAGAPVPPERVRAAGRLAFAMLGGILGDLDSGPDMADVRGDLDTLKEAALHMLTTPAPTDGGARSGRS